MRCATVDAIREVLFRFVAEEANPKNRLGVERVELFYPAGILANGTVLIDTPGMGSTLRHNTEAAMQVLPNATPHFSSCRPIRRLPKSSSITSVA